MNTKLLNTKLYVSGVLLIIICCYIFLLRFEKSQKVHPIDLKIIIGEELKSFSYSKVLNLCSIVVAWRSYKFDNNVLVFKASIQ